MWGSCEVPSLATRRCVQSRAALWWPMKWATLVVWQMSWSYGHWEKVNEPQPSPRLSWCLHFSFLWVTTFCHRKTSWSQLSPPEKSLPDHPHPPPIMESWVPTAQPATKVTKQCSRGICLIFIQNIPFYRTLQNLSSGGVRTGCTDILSLTTLFTISF